MDKRFNSMVTNYEPNPGGRGYSPPVCSSDHIELDSIQQGSDHTGLLRLDYGYQSIIRLGCVYSLISRLFFNIS